MNENPLSRAEAIAKSARAYVTDEVRKWPDMETFDGKTAKVAMSHLSDAQELLDRGDLARANDEVNAVKMLLCDVIDRNDPRSAVRDVANAVADAWNDVTREGPTMVDRDAVEFLKALAKRGLSLKPAAEVQA